MQALGADQQEIKLEAGAHMVQLESGDLLHFYAAATPGWVANGNYVRAQQLFFLCLSLRFHGAGWVVFSAFSLTQLLRSQTAGFIILDKDEPTKVRPDPL